MNYKKWYEQGTLYEMNVRQLTKEGTLRAAIAHLPFLREMGVDAIWLMPIYPIGEKGRKGTLGSYYSIRDYCAVNEEFGEMEDFEAFVAESHRLGMRVLMDWVANHTSRDAVWVGSKPYDWYVRDEHGEPLVPWDWSDTAQLNYQNRDVWWGEVEAMRFWVDKGVDGFRCDMAMLVPLEFWQMVRRELENINPTLLFLAEAEGVEFFDNAFDAVYGWEFHHLMVDVAKGRCRADALRDYLYREQEQYGEGFVKLRFTSNHDENSWQGSHFERFGDACEVMSVLTFVAPNSLSLVYTGQEVEYDHSFNFFERDPIGVPYKQTRASRLYRILSALRHRVGAVDRWTTIRNNAEDCILILVCEGNEGRVLSTLNLSPYTVHLQCSVGIYVGLYQDVMTDQEYNLLRFLDEEFTPWSYRLLLQPFSRS